VEIVRAILRRESLDFHGDEYEIPYAGDAATGLGKPLKLLTRPLRADIPIYLAALSPKNVRLAFDIADGWLPIFFSPARGRAAFEFEPRDAFEIAPTVNVVLSDDVDAARDVLRPLLALYVGGMGARGANFYNALVRRYGYEAEAERIQQLYLEGKQREAIAAVPDALVDEVALVGPRERIAERLDVWRESGATTLLVGTHDPVALRTMAELVL
jgi:F420-dependent oxidoreductase-like protein